METKHEKIDYYELPFSVTAEFERKVLPDNSIILIRYGQDHNKAVNIEREPDAHDGTRRYSLNVPVITREVEAVVILCRTSLNHYTVTGSTLKQSKIGYGKSLKEVGEFIKRWFCRTLLNDN